MTDFREAIRNRRLALGLVAGGVVDRDRAANIAENTYNICYVNAFQTQPGEAAFWTGSHSNLLLKKNGTYVIDPDWPDEYALDTSTAAKRQAITAILNGWIDGCARKGFAAVEPDNLDSYTRYQGLTRAGNLALALAQALVAHAHTKGLAVAQKNTAELGPAEKTSVGFDFAIAEECSVYNECGSYTEVYGNNVIEIEYTDNPRKAYTDACRAQGKKISVIRRDRDVVAAGKPDYHYEYC